MSNRFQEIYEKNEWGHGSGEGSSNIHTKGYQTLLQDFLSRNKITTVVDMGCGDWQFSRFIDWKGINYRGYDVAPVVIARNNQEFARENISFSLYSGNPAELPAADLIIAKDVLQHLPNQMVLDFLPILKKFKFALLTNCTNPRNGNDVNRDIEVGDFRHLDLRLPPFNLDATLVYTFCRVDTGWKEKIQTKLRRRPGWKKLVLLVDNSSQS